MEFPDISKTIKDVKAFLGWDEPPARMLSDRQATAKSLIEGWLGRQSVTQFKLPPEKFAERLRALVDTPQTLRQGAYGWCLSAAFMQSALCRFPDEIVKFGLDLYTNGAAVLGDIDVTMSEAFRVSDYPAEIEAAGLPARNRDLYLAAHADWVVMAGFQEDTSSLVTLTGAIDDPPGGFTTGTLVALFKDSGLYADVTDMWLADKRDRQKLVEALNKCLTHDVCLVSEMNRFGPARSVRHAVRLVAPPVFTANGNSGNPAENETITFQYWSWGFQPDAAASLAFDAGKNAFTFSMTRRQFVANMDIVVAEPKPI